MSMENYSLSDIASVTGGSGGVFGGGGSGAGVLIILFLIIAMMGGGFGGFGNRGGEQYATTADVQRSTDFAALERQNNEIMQNSSNIGAAVTTAIKDGNFNLLGELRDIQMATSAGFGEMQKCCCETLRAIDGVNYNGAINTASINANTTAQVQKILDAINGNRIADLQNQVNQLSLQANLASVVRYPTASTWYAGNNPFCGCGCGTANF